MSMNRLPLRLPLGGPTLEHLRHRERIDWHDHTEQQLVYPSSGLLIVSTSGGSWVVPPQRAVWLPAAVAHAHQAYGATQVRTVAFGVDVNPLGLTQPTVLSVSRLLRELIIAITDDPARPLDEQRDLKRVALHQLKPAPALQFHLPQPGDERLRDVTAILAEDPGSDRTLGELGRAVGAGERTLSRLFRAETGMTFPQWRAQLRLHHSLTLLASGLSVTATAVACGYSTPSAFTAAFHATFGREDLVGLFDHVWDRFWRRMDGLDDEEWRWAPTGDPRISLRWRLGHIRRLLSEDRNGAWLGRPAGPTGLPSRKAGGAAASLAGAQAAFTWWRELVASLDDEALDTPLGEAAGYFAGATGRSFVLHIADELIHHTAEAALLRDLFAGASVRS
jgi:AraC-like DNA-binding protein